MIMPKINSRFTFVPSIMLYWWITQTLNISTLLVFSPTWNQVQLSSDFSPTHRYQNHLSSSIGQYKRLASYHIGSMLMSVINQVLLSRTQIQKLCITICYSMQAPLRLNWMLTYQWQMQQTGSLWMKDYSFHTHDLCIGWCKVFHHFGLLLDKLWITWQFTGWGCRLAT